MTPLQGFCVAIFALILFLYRLQRYSRELTFTTGRRRRRLMLLRALLTAVPVLSSNLSSAAAPVDAMFATEEICMPEGTYPMIGGGTTVFSLKTCFSRPVTDTDPREKRVPRAKKSSRDTFNGARVVRYDYHDALYHCANRHRRLPTVDELKALFVYANAGSSSATERKYAIVAPKNDSRYPGGLHGWGGSSLYWSHTFAGRRVHKVVNLSDGRVSIYHDPQRGYVSCVR
ncbi:hypothetical protein R75461_05951 [Paraburkholderia nemoris]|nr:hypothetical protein [Paraburkholderia aspalathi]MBK3785700.1 DUF1566 domain-containing protein [Paraburkholderia aspalathi]CAE6817696.1 hypothetical protein R75461_05951 [Paraburkholderia nemoris]